MKTFHELVNILRRIGENQKNTPISAIPEIFRRDFIVFVSGETLIKENGELVVSPKLIKRWLHKIFHQQGLDYEIDLKNE
jgi:hypothetical protein